MLALTVSGMFSADRLGARSDGWRRWLPLLERRLALPSGLLIGESGVLSTCVHLLKQTQPGIVTILTNADAGRVFYRRRRPGEVVHLDVFHESGEVDHLQVARSIRRMLDAYTLQVARLGSSEATVPALADYVDVQTATGGGRITGSLAFGRRETLQRAHRNHVHLAGLLPRQDLLCVFYLLAGVEEAILACGLQLRRVEGIEYDRGGEGRLSLADYTSPSDSLIRDPTGDAGGTDGGHPADAASDEGQEGGDAAPAAAELRATALALAKQLESEAALQSVLEVLERVPSLREAVEALRRRGLDAELIDRALSALTAAGFAQRQAGEVQLTTRGRRLADYVLRQGHELRIALRKA
ncbi:MAG TPA: hypothetical protein VIL95_02705, partial [Bacillota bacterium]